MLGSCLAATLLWCNAALLWCNALWHVLGSCTVHDVMSYIMLLGAAVGSSCSGDYINQADGHAVMVFAFVSSVVNGIELTIS